MAARDPYIVLNVARTATDAQIKAAYRKLAKDLHPDLHPDDAVVADRFKEVSAAYDLLSDKDKRSRYDRGEIDADGNVFIRRPPPGAQRRRGPTVEEAAAGAQSRDDVLAELMKTMRAARSRVFDKAGEDVNYRLSLSMAEAASGTTTRLKLKDGRTLDVKIPPGVREGHVIRLRGQGEPGSGAAASGDALVEITLIPDGRFTIDGDHVRLDLPITLVEAVKGARITVPTLDGSVALAVPAGASSGKILRLKGKGMTRADGTKGDQYVRLMIVLPDPVDPELETFIDAWSKSRPYAAKR